MAKEADPSESSRKLWNYAAKSFVEFVRSGKNYYSEYLNGPALKRMVGDVKGKRVLDIGCGEGTFSRFFAQAGADVVGVDVSEALIEAAVEEERRRRLGIKYIATDAAKLNMLESETFDLVYSYMAIMDIADYEGAIAEAARVLKIGGRFIIVMTHPCFEIWSINGKKVGFWETRLRKDGTKEYLYYRIEEYFQRSSYTTEWKHDRLSSGFVTTGFHRTLSDYMSSLIKNGLVITGFDEPQPLKEGVKLLPSMEKHYRVPHSLAIEAIKLPLCLR